MQSVTSEGGPRRWLRLTAAALPVMGAIVTPAIASAPLAKAQTPGVPQPAAVVFQENFENIPGTEPVSLADYVGRNGETYTADPAWLTDCNGEVVNFNMTTLPANCDAGPQAMYMLRSMAYALGVLRRAVPDTNNALSAYTDKGNNTPADPGPDKVQFETEEPIALPTGTGKHYITFSVDAGSVNCPNNAPELQFYLLSDHTQTPVGGAINTCTDPRGHYITVPYGGPSGGNINAYTGTYVTSEAIPFSGTSLGLRMVNAQGSGNGNDSAIDNMSVLDATPHLDKSFTPATQVAGLPSRLTLTITNTDDLLAKPGWSLTDTLKDGMTIANPADVSTTCQNSTWTAAAGTRLIRLAGDLAAGEDSCTLSLNVTGATGSYTNGAADITSDGVLPPASDTPVTFVEPNPEITVSKTPAPATASKAGDLVSYEFVVTNTGNVDLSDVTLTDAQVPPAGNLASGPSCPEKSLAPRDTMKCSATYILSQADMDHGRVDDAATVTGNPPAVLDLPPASGSGNATVTVSKAPALTIRKTAVPATVTAVGQVVTYRYHVTNTGNTTIHGIVINESGFSGTGVLSPVTCPVTTLAPGERTTCTATYTITRADIAAGGVTNVAVAAGRRPSGRRVFSPIARLTIPVTRAAVPVTG